MAEIIYHIATTTENYIADLNGDCPPTMFVYEGDQVSEFLSQNELPRGKPTGYLRTVSTALNIPSHIRFLYLDFQHIF